MFGSSSPFGASTSTMFGGASPSSSPFGSSTSTAPFGMNAAPSNPFAAKPFGAPAFGAQTGGLFGSGTATGVFGSQAAPFGSTSPAFGAPAPASPFGSSQSAFGSTGASVFGQQKPASPFGSFGSTTPQQSNPFGSPSFGGFGTQQQQPQQAPAFGSAPSTSAFGTSTLPAFGSSTPAFNSQPAPAFGNPFGSTTPAFGQAPSFGQTTPSPAFGSTGSAFGSGGFGQASSSFGSTMGFGVPMNKPGSRVVPYTPKSEMDGTTPFKLLSVSAMDVYKDKCHEELRWEDYQAGDKGGPAPNSTGVFGQPANNSPFPSSPALTPAPSPFAPSPFQQPKPSTSFPSFNTGASPAFGSSTSSPSLFGTSTPSYSSAPAFSFSAPAPLFNTSPAFTPSTSSFGSSTGFGVQPSTPGLFSAPQQQQQPQQQSSLFGNSLLGTGTTSAFNVPQTKPAGSSQSTPFFGSTPAPSAFTFTPTQTQPGLFGTSSTLNPAQPFGAPPMTNTMAPVPAPVIAPFGTLPAMPQMSIGRAAGSNPSVQYGISSIPVSEKPAQMRSNSLLTPRHITPRSKIRMHSRKSNSNKKDTPRVSFFSDGEDAPVTPKADVAFIPRENPRALFINPVNQSPVTPVAAKRTADAVISEQTEDVFHETGPFVDDDSMPREVPEPDWSIPLHPDIAPKSGEKSSSKSSKQNGVREELNHKGNGYISMTGHRAGEAAIAYEHGADIEALMPKLKHSDYYTEPRVQELAAKERAEPGYCRRVPDFIVGRKGYGHIKFLGETDVRRLDIEGIIQFNKCEVLVYMDESKKPPLGQGLNKPATVTLDNVKCIEKSTGRSLVEGPQVERFENKLRKKTQAQGAEFVSFDPVKGEWAFRVKHFSRYGLDDSDDSDDDDHGKLDNGKLVPLGMDMMEDDTIYAVDKPLSPTSPGEEEEEPLEDLRSRNHRTALPHSLPAQLRLNPLKMQQLKSSFFPVGEEDPEEMHTDVTTYRRSTRMQLPAVPAAQKPFFFLDDAEPKSSPPSKGRPTKQIKLSSYSLWQRSPVSSPQQSSAKIQVLASMQSLSKSSQRSTTSGFRLEEEKFSCTESCVDAALFMGASFRVGWGPNGVFAHTGSLSSSKTTLLSSCVSIKKVALDRTARDEQAKVRSNLLDLQFSAPLSLHWSYSKVVNDTNGLKLRSLVCNRVQLEKLCNDYEDLIVRQHDASGILASDQLVLKHQLMVWQLISVLFSEKETLDTDVEEAMESMHDVKARMANIDPETRRAEFSSWLQASVFPLVQADLDAAAEANHLKDILMLLTGKQVETSVNKAILEGDVRLACLLAQAAGSVMNREDMASQLEDWESDCLCDEFVEQDRIALFKLLGGDIHGALGDRQIDWKRFLGMLMWYMLPPEAELPEIVLKFKRDVDVGDAPQPLPMYVEEAPEGGKNVMGTPAYDSAFYMMLLHASGGLSDADIQKMFTAAASTFDALDHRAAWHQKTVLQAIGVLGPFNSFVLDMSFAAQLLAAGLVQWAVYVILHMPLSSVAPGFHERVVKEVLSQYCEVWSTSESQQQFLEEELEIPTEWLHEALATYCLYRRDFVKRLEHLLKCLNWQEAHVLFVTQVSACWFFNGEHVALWESASQLEAHKIEIDNWDLGAGLFLDFFTLKWSFRKEGDEGYDPEADSPPKAKVSACENMFERLKDAERLWEGAGASKLLRVAMSKMAGELASLLVVGREGFEFEVQSVALKAPVPEDVQLCRLQGAVSSFATWISEAVTC